MTTRKKILEFIIQYKKAHDGNAPTLAVIARDISAGKSTVHHHIGKLIKEGKLRRGEAGLEVVGGHWLYEPDLTEAEPVEVALIENIKHLPTYETLVRQSAIAT